MKTVKFIGDVHGKWGGYCEIVRKANENDINTLQVGDFGFKPHYKCLKYIDPSKNRILLGNHDDYTDYINYPHFLGDYGVYHPYSDYKEQIFYIRGENSIDKRYRVEYRDWFPQEQLSYKQGLQCLKMYEQVKPKIVVSHGCPSSIIDDFSTMSSFDGLKLYPSMTAELLQCLLEIHRPFVWVFGHYHNDKRIIRNGVEFICVNELSTYDVEV